MWFCQDWLSGRAFTGFQGEYVLCRAVFVCRLFVCVRVAWWLKQIRRDSEFCDELCRGSGGSCIARGHSELEEWNWWVLCVYVYVVRLSHCHLPVSSPYLSICRLFIPVPFSLGCIFLPLWFSLSSAWVFFFPFPALVFSSSFWEFSHPSLNLPLVLVFSSPSALVLFSIPLQRSVDCDDGGGRESAHWFFWQGNVKVCKPVCKCQSVWRCLANGDQGADVMSVCVFLMHCLASRTGRCVGAVAPEPRGSGGWCVGVDGFLYHLTVSFNYRHGGWWGESRSHNLWSHHCLCGCLLDFTHGADVSLHVRV